MESLETGRKDFFFEKKKQKTFANLAAAFTGRLSPDSQKFFGSFFQKSTAFCLTHSAATRRARVPAETTWFLPALFAE
jgi:hypothetical protein